MILFELSKLREGDTATYHTDEHGTVSLCDQAMHVDEYTDHHPGAGSVMSTIVLAPHNSYTVVKYLGSMAYDSHTITG